MADTRRELEDTLNGNRDEHLKKLEGLSDKDLEEIGGGNFAQWILCDKDYRSGSTPKYSVGQKVHIRVTGRNRYDGVIEAVGGKTGGINNTEFVYSVRVYGDQFQRQFHPEGWVENGIYESNIRLL